jgi:hypothetical protein
MLYTIYFENNSVEKNQSEIIDYIESINVKKICSIWKDYNYKNIKGLCLYDSEFVDTDYIGNYISLPEMYGFHCINTVDVKLLNYIQLNMCV